MLALVGPTAVGKSALALRVAPAIDAEIVSVDSATVYRKMDVGTAKPNAGDRAAVRHHLLDRVDPWDTPTVADFQRWGREAVAEILEGGKVPLLVGGSGLYFRAVVDPLEFPGTDPELRRQLEAELAESGPEKLYRRLVVADPAAAEKIHPSNTRRTIRALEVLALTGEPFSSFRNAWEERRSIYDLCAVGLTLPTEELDRRIDVRIDTQLNAGWVDEVARLREVGGFSGTSIKVLGYAHILSYLDGSASIEETAAQIKQRTRQFARRQLRWFRADPRIKWFEEPEQAAEYLIENAR